MDVEPPVVAVLNLEELLYEEVLLLLRNTPFFKGNLKAEEQVVSHNAGLVRLSHLEAFGASGDGHGH